MLETCILLAGVRVQHEQCDHMCYSKVAQFPRKLPESSHNSVHLKSYVFQISQKVPKYLDYFCKTICCTEVKKSANLVTLINHEH